MRLLLHQLRFEQLIFWRNREAAFFTFFLPVIFFLIFGSVYGKDFIKKEHVKAAPKVKARRGDRFGQPVEAVNWRKQKELVKSAQVWIDRHGRPEESYRFDVVGVLMKGDRVCVRHVEDAFKVARSG